VTLLAMYLYSGAKRNQTVAAVFAVRNKQLINQFSTVCRPFELKLHQYTGMVTSGNPGEYAEDKKLVFRAVRPFACTFYCINR